MKKVFLFGDRSKRINYVEAIEANGGEAVVSSDPERCEECSGLLLPGGADIDPEIYGAENLGSRGIDRDLDRIELALIQKFLQNQKPILGICRGLQMINVAFGGDMIQDLPSASDHCWEESTGDKQHLITAEKSSFLYKIYGSSFSVNSAHHQGAGQVPQELHIAAAANDGVVEALELPGRRVYAVQWHPERMTLRRARPDTVDGGKVFQFFIGLL